MKRSFVVVLVLTMLFSLTFSVLGGALLSTVEVQAETGTYFDTAKKNATAMTLGKNAKHKIDHKAVHEGVFKFTPSETAFYHFSLVIFDEYPAITLSNENGDEYTKGWWYPDIGEGLKYVLEKGRTYYFEVGPDLVDHTYISAKITKESSKVVKSLTVKDVVVDYDSARQENYVDEDGNWKEYNKYTFYYPDFAVTTKDGKKYDYADMTRGNVHARFIYENGFTYTRDVEWNVYDFQTPKSPWGIGTHIAYMVFDGVVVPFKVTIKKNTKPQISSLSADNVTLYEGNCTRLWEEKYDESTGAWVQNFSKGWNYYTDLTPKKITVKLKNGKTVSGDEDYILENLGYYVGIVERDMGVEGQSYENQYKPGTYKMTLTVGESSADYKLIIKPTPVSSVEVEDLTLLEGDTSYLKRGNSYYYNYIHYSTKPNKIKVKLKSGKTYSGSPDEVLEQIKEKEGYELDYAWEDEQSETKKWSKGKHKATFIFGGVSKTFNVNIIANQISSVSAANVRVREGSGSIVRVPVNDVGNSKVLMKYDVGEYDVSLDEKPVALSKPKSITLKIGKKTYKGTPDEVVEKVYDELGYTLRYNYVAQDVYEEWATGDHLAMFTIGGNTSMYRVTIFDEDGINIKKATVTGIKSSYAATESAIKPAPVVKMTIAGETVTLKEGTDYTVKYKNNVKEGTATVTITGKGDFTGTISKTFTITPHKHSLKKTEAKDATYEAAGNKAYWTCSLCGKLYSDAKGTKETTIKAMTIPKLEPVNKVIRRAYGNDRYDTAFAISDLYLVDSGKVKGYEGITRGAKRTQTLDAIIVACGSNFPDALAASYLASVKNAPVIIWRERDNARVQEYIKANVKAGKRVYIMGGTGAVGSGIANGLSGYKFTRLGGENRYETNVKILKAAGVTGGEIFVCDGTNFENALIASAAGKPILLVKPNGVTREGLNFIAGLKNPKFTIIGNEKSVAASVETQLKAYGQVTRIGGSNPDQVSVNVAKKYFSNPKGVVVATSTAFADALCGGVLAIQNKTPLLLITDAQSTKSVAYAKTLKNLETVTALGGTAVVSDALTKKILDLESKKIDTVELYRYVQNGKGYLAIGSREV